MHSLLISDLKNSFSEEMISLSIEQKKKAIGGGFEEDTTIVFIGLKPPIVKVIFLGPPIPSL